MGHVNHVYAFHISNCVTNCNHCLLFIYSFFIIIFCHFDFSIDILCPSQQVFSHVRMKPLHPEYFSSTLCSFRCLAQGQSLVVVCFKTKPIES